MGRIFNPFDAVVVLVIAVSLVSAVTRSLAAEIVSFGSAVVGLLLAYLLYHDVASQVAAIGMEEMLSTLVGFLGVFFACVLLGIALSLTVDKAVRHIRVWWFDRLLCLALGLLRGCMIGVVLFLALTAFPVRKDLLVDSRTAGLLATGADALSRSAPAEIRTRFQEGYQELFESGTRNGKETPGV